MLVTDPTIWSEALGPAHESGAWFLLNSPESEVLPEGPGSLPRVPGSEIGPRVRGPVSFLRVQDRIFSVCFFGMYISGVRVVTKECIFMCSFAKQRSQKQIWVVKMNAVSDGITFLKDQHKPPHEKVPWECNVISS